MSFDLGRQGGREEAGGWGKRERGQRSEREEKREERRATSLLTFCYTKFSFVKKLASQPLNLRRQSLQHASWSKITRRHMPPCLIGYAVCAMSGGHIQSELLVCLVVTETIIVL